MARYINVDDLIKRIERFYKKHPSNYVFNKKSILYLLEKQAEHDNANIVRCKECKFRDGTPGQPNIMCGNMHDDDFCGYGEKREDR